MSVSLEELKDLVTRTIIRLELGQFVIRGPRENVMELESRVAFETVAGQLQHEGFAMVTPEEYAKRYRVTAETVLRRIEKEGGLFAIEYGGHDETLMLVPMEEREARDDLGPIPR